MSAITTFEPGARIALVFPGQAAQSPEMLDPFRSDPRFAVGYSLVCDLLHRDPLADAPERGARLHENATSSLLTVLASVLALDRLRSQHEALTPVGTAGYSVGQWSAMYAAGMIELEPLLRTVYARAMEMNRCDAAAKGGMLAVVGVREADLSRICETAHAAGHFLAIANFNAPAHYSLSGSADGLAFAEEQLQILNPKVLLRVPVAGAWHCALLQPAVGPFRSWLEDLRLANPRLPVIDNVTAQPLPDQPGELRARLAQHLAVPVCWRQDIEALAQSGATAFVEVGFGNILTKFGMFIARKARHVAFTDLAGAAA